MHRHRNSLFHSFRDDLDVRSDFSIDPPSSRMGPVSGINWDERLLGPSLAPLPTGPEAPAYPQYKYTSMLRLVD